MPLLPSVGNHFHESACGGDKLHQTGEELGQVTNGSPDPKQRSWAQVGGFMYHFARVEQKINQAVIKLTELDAKSAPVVELIDFAKKVDLVQKSAYAQTTENAKDKEFAKDVCSKAFTMNQYRRIVAHASFEPTGDGVQFSRAVTSKRGEVLPVTEPWTEADFTKCYAEMGALETDLDKLIELLKPTPKGWFFQNVDVINPPIRNVTLYAPASDWVPQPPPKR